jgi:hypothetical protein
VLNLVSSDILVLKVSISPPVVHAHIVLKKTSSVVAPVPLPFSGSINNYSCVPFQGPPGPSPPPASHARLVLGQHSGMSGGCPLRFRSKLASPAHKPKLPPGANTAGPFCYQLNDAMGYQLAWSVDLVANTVSVTLSVNAAGGDWVGLGFAPDFPGMNGSDIVLGYVASNGESCVQSLYAEEYVGPPTSINATLDITDPAASYAAGRVSVSFTRPVKSGHNPLQLHPSPESVPFLLMYATGPGPYNDCVAMPGYHQNTRGFSSVDWVNPSTVFDDAKRC